MRHNQSSRHARGRGRGHSNGGGNGGGQRRMNPRVQTFDSNGPDVRIRGNAYQVVEKYLALARDANSGGDRVLAESYLQHAEHYQRLINELEAENNNRPAHAAGDGPQPDVHEARQQAQGDDSNNDSDDEKDDMNDLDQGFLVGNRRGKSTNGMQAADDHDHDNADDDGGDERAVATAAVASSVKRRPRTTAKETETA